MRGWWKFAFREETQKVITDQPRFKYQMPQLSKARLAQLQAAWNKRVSSNADTLPANSRPRIVMDIVKGRDAGWMSQDDGLSGEFNSEKEHCCESDSEYDINSEEDGEEEEGVGSGELTGSEVTGDVVLTATGFLKYLESKSAYELLDMYYEDDKDEDEGEKERKAKYRGESKATFYQKRKEARERAKEASASYSIWRLFERQQLLGISLKSKYSETGSMIV